VEPEQQQNGHVLSRGQNEYGQNEYGQGEHERQNFHVLSELRVIFDTAESNHSGTVVRAELMAAIRINGKVFEVLELPEHVEHARKSRVVEQYLSHDDGDDDFGEERWSWEEVMARVEAVHEALAQRGEKRKNTQKQTREHQKQQELRAGTGGSATGRPCLSLLPSRMQLTAADDVKGAGPSDGYDTLTELPHEQSDGYDTLTELPHEHSSTELQHEQSHEQSSRFSERNRYLQRVTASPSPVYHNFPPPSYPPPSPPPPADFPAVLAPGAERGCFQYRVVVSATSAPLPAFTLACLCSGLRYRWPSEQHRVYLHRAQASLSTLHASSQHRSEKCVLRPVR
jgi:hypothetical protein